MTMDIVRLLEQYEDSLTVLWFLDLDAVIEILSDSLSETKKKPVVKRSESKGLVSTVKSSYESIINAFIRPPRQVYDISQLGDQRFLLCDKFRCSRKDLTLKNKYEQQLQCSFFDRDDLGDKAPRPCVIVCHANSGSRMKAKQMVRLLLPFGVSVFCFDFCGSGLSDGEYVTLGKEQGNCFCFVLALTR